MTLECDSCHNTCTNKDTLWMHKDMKHKPKLSNCDKCDCSCIKNEVPVIHKFVNNGGQEPPKKTLQAVWFNLPDYWRPQISLKCWTFRTKWSLKSLNVICVITQPKKYTFRKHRIREYGIQNTINKRNIVTVSRVQVFIHLGKHSC